MANDAVIPIPDLHLHQKDTKGEFHKYRIPDSIVHSMLCDLLLTSARDFHIQG